MRKLIVVTLSGLLVGAAAFGIACDDDEPTSEEATADVCESLQELATALEGVDALTVNSTIEEAEEAEEAVADAMENVRSASEDLAEARLDDLDAAYEELANSFDDISGEDTIGEAGQTLVTNAAGVAAARQQLSDDLNCA